MASAKSQASASAVTSTKGDVTSIDLGKYRLGALLGKGAFGQVWRMMYTVFGALISIVSMLTLFRRAGVQGIEHRKWRGCCCQASAAQCHQHGPAGQCAPMLLLHRRVATFFACSSSFRRHYG